MEYFCVFCEDRFKDKDEARRHYQKHINYKPFICSLCGEGTTDLNEFLKHHTDVHPDAEKGRYKRREQPHIDKWINGFLYAQATIIRALPPREICPVCDKVFSQDQIIAARPRRCTVNRKIDHVHRHLCYLPYECLRCKAEGKEFLVAYFESKAHSHIKLKHPEVDDTESRWNLFQKTHAIPKLDEWIGEFLRRYGISMDFERRPVKKTMRDPGCADGSGVSDSLSVSGQHLAVLSSEHDSYDDSDSMVASEHGDEMIVAVAPHNTEAWLSMEDASNAFRLRPEYFCVFCPTKFTDKSEAYPHYGAHLDYRPISCTYCKISFHGMRPFTLHHQNTHPEFDLKYGVKEDHDIERWVDGFLESQRKVNVRRLTMNCSCGACCKVCSHFVGQRAASASPCASHSEVLFSDHAHRHLEYFPYECAICMITGKSTRVPNLDSFAVEHLRVEHKVKNSSVAQLARSFPKTLTIPVLERYIEDSLQKKRAIERKRVASVVANRQIALPAPAMSRVIKDGNRMIVEHPLLLRANKIDRSKLPPPTPPQVSSTILDFTGRVLISCFASPGKCLPHSRRGWKSGKSSFSASTTPLVGKAIIATRDQHSSDDRSH